MNANSPNHNSNGSFKDILKKTLIKTELQRFELNTNAQNSPKILTYFSNGLTHLQKNEFLFFSLNLIKILTYQDEKNKKELLYLENKIINSVKRSFIKILSKNTIPGKILLHDENNKILHSYHSILILYIISGIELINNLEKKKNIDKEKEKDKEKDEEKEKEKEKNINEIKIVLQSLLKKKSCEHKNKICYICEEYKKIIKPHISSFDEDDFNITRHNYIPKTIRGMPRSENKKVKVKSFSTKKLIKTCKIHSKNKKIFIERNNKSINIGTEGKILQNFNNSTVTDVNFNQTNVTLTNTIKDNFNNGNNKHQEKQKKINNCSLKFNDNKNTFSNFFTKCIVHKKKRSDFHFLNNPGQKIMLNTNINSNTKNIINVNSISDREENDEKIMITQRGNDNLIKRLKGNILDLYNEAKKNKKKQKKEKNKKIQREKLEKLIQISKNKKDYWFEKNKFKNSINSINSHNHLHTTSKIDFNNNLNEIAKNFKIKNKHNYSNSLNKNYETNDRNNNDISSFNGFMTKIEIKMEKIEKEIDIFKNQTENIKMQIAAMNKLRAAITG